MEALHANGPWPELADELMLFGQFVGEWELDWVGYGPDGSRQTAKGEWHFGWVLEGRAVQDVWIVPSRDRRAGEVDPPGEYGTTVRFYDPRIGAWRVVWVGPANGNLRTFVARKAGDEIVLEGTTADGRPMRWIFSEISDRSFHWRSVVSDDEGKTWRTDEEMAVRRRERAT